MLHPLLMPTLLHGLLLAFAPSVFTRLDDDNQWRLLLMIFILTFLLPLFITYFLLQAGWAGALRSTAGANDASCRSCSPPSSTGPIRSC